MKVWNLLYVVSVQSVFVQCMIWGAISWCTRTTNSFVVVCVVNISNAKITLYNTLRNVPLSFNLHVEFDVYDWVCVVKRPFDCCRRRSGKILEYWLVSPEISVLPDSLLRNVQVVSNTIKYTWSFCQVYSVFRCCISTVLKSCARHSLMSVLV